MKSTRERLEEYWVDVTRIIMTRQHAASGLIPASVAVTAHGDYRDAWVRDNVYSIAAVWGLGLAYRRLDDDMGRAYELEHATVKCMRGLLFAMMRQAQKVELFKGTQALNQALHAKYNTATGDTVVADNAWGHLQLDATAIFLLFLAQMTVSGLHIIYTIDEVQFIQNLVFYIERAYRTPDYGVWERGNKINHGQPELNCSSIGMVVAALQAINGINLFGSRGGPSSIIHVLPDEIARNYTTLHSALPRESPSKEIDAALLAVISFPAFAVGDKALIDRTRKDIIKKLGGRYGCKRFLRDGHQTVLEDHNRLHYEPHELKIFENVESEWPLFFTYLILDGLFFGDNEQVEHYLSMIEPLLVNSNTVDLYSTSKSKGNGYESEEEPAPMLLVPELYIVPRESIEAEKTNHGSQDRVPNQNIPLVWAQSLYIMGKLIHEGLLSVADVDPLGRRLASTSSRSNSDTVVQIVLLAETEELQAKLLMHGLQTYTIQNCEPITISKPACLRDAYTFLGKNSKLGLSGRPDRPMGTLSTCKIYRCQGHLYAFQPHFMDKEEFYPSDLVSDNDYLVSLFEQEISSVRNLWMQNGRPTMVVMLTRQMIGNTNMDGIGISGPNRPKEMSKRNLLNFLISIGSAGICQGTRVRVGRLSEMVNTACVESLDFLATQGDGQQDWGSILAGREARLAAQKLKAATTGRRESLTLHLHTRGRSIRTYKKDPHEATPLKSPLARSLGYPGEMEDLDLLDLESNDSHNSFAVENERRRMSPIKSSPESSTDVLTGATDSKPVALVLGNPAQSKEAIILLSSCSNLYDQMDLLHYLYSCHGGDFLIPGLAPLNVLVEEVYGKAMHAKQWSIVRYAAGVLKKTVNSLTSNLADLLIRQRPVTIGIKPKEYFIDSPKNPSALAQIIFDHCKSDAREAPLIQEVITYLGQIIRSSPVLFQGIMRVRTHFFVIAMREEISRSARCYEEEAIEQLMALSPYEMKSLLQQVLVAHNQIDSFLLEQPLLTPRARAFELQHGEKGKEPRSVKQELCVSLQSGGFSAGNFAEFGILNNGVPVQHALVPGRGLNMVVIDPYSGSIVHSCNYDLHLSPAEADHFVAQISSIQGGFIVMLAGKDDFVENMTEAALTACESVGSALIRNAQYRDSWCMIGEKGAKIGSVPEFHRSAMLGPTDKITRVFDLAEPRKGGGSLDRKGSFVAQNYLPSNGWWLRRRRNDGALNRVPAGFYPKVWRLLSKTTGIQVGNAVLKSHPTISESTPEELNFALQVENLLDNIYDPAEHQLAVECLVVISRIEERNPELTLVGSVIDVKRLIGEANKQFWDKWISEQSHQSIVTPLICRGAAAPNLLQKVLDSVSQTPIHAAAPPMPQSQLEEEQRNSAAKSPLGVEGVQSVSRRLGEKEGRMGLHFSAEFSTTSDGHERVSSQGADLSFEQNDRLARRIFFDLRQDGAGGTMSYLASACVRLVFGVNWSNEQSGSIGT